MMTSLYFHVPFCRRRCGYCDFVTFAGFERLIPDYLLALEKQVTLFGKGESVHTIFFGGGTPSLVFPENYAKLFLTIYANFSVDPVAEITLEANPGTVNIESLEGYRKIGFNRISFGMQSARNEELRLLDRSHKPDDVDAAVNMARKAGFENINLDLIFGLPGQSLDDWKYSLEKALDLSPEHLSIYSLIVEENTPLERNISIGRIPLPDDDIVADQYEWTCQYLEKHDYAHYEISNWAKTDQGIDYRCQHNLQYWRLLPYFGFGCGAVGFLPSKLPGEDRSAVIMENERWIGRYIRQVDRACHDNLTDAFLRSVSKQYEMETRMFVGFRLLDEGIDPADFFTRFKMDIDDVFGVKLKRLIYEGLVEKSPKGNYKLTRDAWLIANRVFREFSTEVE